jgi:hypothetical protein
MTTSSPSCSIQELLSQSANYFHASISHSFTSILNSAHKDVITADFTTDRAALWTVGLSELRVADPLHCGPVDGARVKALSQGLRRRDPNGTSRLPLGTTVSATINPSNNPTTSSNQASRNFVPFSAPVQRQLLTRAKTADPVEPSNTVQHTVTESQEPASSRFRKLLSTWTQHFAGGTPASNQTAAASKASLQKQSANTSAYFDAEGDEASFLFANAHTQSVAQAQVAGAGQAPTGGQLVRPLGLPPMPQRAPLQPLTTGNFRNPQQAGTHQSKQPLSHKAQPQSQLALLGTPGTMAGANLLSVNVTPVIPGRRSVAEPPVMLGVGGLFGGPLHRPVLHAIGDLREEENYEVSEKDTDSENEKSETVLMRRKLKKIPEWCRGWREKCLRQMAIDPESIFGIYMPSCDLGVIFTEGNYRTMRKLRPRRIRGSSGNWKLDKLRVDEVDKYRVESGQVLKAEGVFV